MKNKRSEVNQALRLIEAKGVASFISKEIDIRLDENREYIEELRPGSQLTNENSIPILNPNHCESRIADSLFSEVPEMAYDSRIGFYNGLYAGYVSEGDYRSEGSSGGFGSWVVDQLFLSDQIDGVIHVKKSNNSESRTLFEYGISYSAQEARNGAKTKYFPVEVSNVLKVIQDRPGRYALVGIPGVISNVRTLSSINPVIGDRIKYYIGLICGHQKSAHFADFIAWQCGIKPDQLVDIDFRKKSCRGKASDYSMEVTGLIDGKIVIKNLDKKDALGLDWGYGFFKLWSSNFTDDVFNETADVVIGDAWLPQFNNDPKGNNIIICRNSQIKNLIEIGINNSTLSVKKVNASTAYDSQDAHFRHTAMELSARLRFLPKSKSLTLGIRQKFNTEISMLRKILQMLRVKISLASHKHFKVAVEKNSLTYFYLRMLPLIAAYKTIYVFLSIERNGLIGLWNKLIQKLTRK